MGTSIALQSQWMDMLAEMKKVLRKSVYATYCFGCNVAAAAAAAAAACNSTCKF
ncbi:hypothetical protein OIU78_005225 [Salix suchowensis]|nr:hypothetical protein OIU78_005225 [Salix suchowensis]